MQIVIRAAATLVGIAVFGLGAFAQAGENLLFQALQSQGLNGGPSPQQMLQRVSPQVLEGLESGSVQIAQNPRNANAWVTRGAYALKAAHQSYYGVFWLHFAAKDLEHALQIDPNNYYGHHNYAEVCFEFGDSAPGMPVEHLAITHFTEAIRLNPRSARSYMGRGWAYLMIGDEARANADFQRTLQLDPSLQPELVREANGVRQARAQRGCAQATLARMGAYRVIRTARTPAQCAAARGVWINSECRSSTAMAPGPLMTDPRDSATANAGLNAASCAPPPDASDYKYNQRLGGYVVK